MASALANRARGAIVGSAVADAAGKKLVFRPLLAHFRKKPLNCKLSVLFPNHIAQANIIHTILNVWDVLRNIIHTFAACYQ